MEDDRKERDIKNKLRPLRPISSRIQNIQKRDVQFLFPTRRVLNPSNSSGVWAEPLVTENFYGCNKGPLGDVVELAGDGAGYVCSVAING